MKKEARRISMKLRGFGKEPLITDEIALEIAKLMFIREFGPEDFQLQQPLTIRDEGNSWLVEGSREYDYEAPRDNQIVEGKALIEIDKENGAILALTKTVDLTGPEPR